MHLKLDKRDRRLLLELDRNCRRPLKELARTIDGALETTRYRIERLLKLGIIKNFITVIDGGRLGFYYYKVFFRLFNVSEQKIQEIMVDLAADPQICWVIRVSGTFDVGFTPRVFSPGEQSMVLDRLRRKYAPFLKRWTLSVNIHMDFLARDYLVGSSLRTGPLGSYSTRESAVALDGAAEKVLVALAQTPRESASAIAASTGLSTDVVLHRIRLLEQKKVVVRYALVTDVQVLGHVNFYVLIYLSNIKVNRERAFVEYCHRQPNIVYLIKSLGEWDYELSVEAGTIAEYRKVMVDLTQNFADIIQEYNGMMVEQVLKYVYP